MSYIASRLSVVKPSASMAVSQAAKNLRAQGIDVIDLGLGEPDFPTPAHVTAAAHAAALSGDTLYTAAPGTPALREAVARKFRRENGFACEAADIVVANGAKQIIFNALMATLEPGDEAILPAPYFVSYPEMVKLLGGTPVIVECGAEDGFRLTPAALEAAITPSTKWLFLNLPGNPSGAVYPEAQLKALGAVLAKHPQVLVLSDEIYEHIIFDRQGLSGTRGSLADRQRRLQGLCDDRLARRLRCGPRAPLVKAMTTIQSQTCTSVCSIAQAAGLAALAGPQDCVATFREAFQRRRDLVVAGIAKVDGLTLDAPEGAFYAYIGCAALIGQRTPGGEVLADDNAVAQYLLTEGRVASVPGAAYGLSPFFRISTATSEEVLTEAIARIATAIAALQPAKVSA